MQGVAKQGKSKLIRQAEQSGYCGRGRVSISAKRSHLSCVLVTAGTDMGVAKDGVVMHLAWVVEKLPGLVTAMARVDFAWGLGVEDRELVTAVGEDVDITRLDTAIDVVVVVVVGVDEVALELDEEELASALLRA